MRLGFLLALAIFFFACTGKSKSSIDSISSDFRPIYPHKNLQEFIIYGYYYPEDGYSIRAIKYYCYNKTQNKSPSLNENLRARLYDKDSRLLTEDFLRFGKYKNSSNQPVVTYVPYHEDGHEVRIVRLEGEKEIILKEQEFLSQSKLREISGVDNSLNEREHLWTFNYVNECHISPLIK